MRMILKGYADHGRSLALASAGTDLGASLASAGTLTRHTLKLRGRWLYLYRAIDREGNLIDAMLSKHRDMAVVKTFFRSAKATMSFRPNRETTDGHGSDQRAIRMVLGRTVLHWTSPYLNNPLEQDHRGIRVWIRCLRGIRSSDAAQRVCREHRELRDLLRPRRRHNHIIPAAVHRSRFTKAAGIALKITQSA